MAKPNVAEFGAAIASAYSAQGVLAVPSGMTLVSASLSSEQSSGFSAEAFKDLAGNIIIAFEGTTLGGALTSGSYSQGALGADNKIISGELPSALADAATFAKQVELG